MTAKVYVDVLAVFSREGELIPTAFVWEDGRKYAIDKVSKPERCASRKAGGTGYRYTCQVGGKICHMKKIINGLWNVNNGALKGSPESGPPLER